jgi:hypothetical protein
MRITEEQIANYSQALNKSAPDWDPDWQITQELLKMVTMQARQLMYLQKQLDIMKRTRQSSMESLIMSLNQSMNVQAMEQRSLRPEEVQAAITELNKSIEAAAKGERAAEYAANVLKFVARVVI